MKYMQRPNNTELVELWLTTHFNNQPSIVFFDIFNNKDSINVIRNISQRFDVPLSKLTGDSVYILPYSDADICNVVNHLSLKDFGFAMAWDGSSFITYNS